MDAFWRLPPFSRTLATAAFVISIGIHSGLLPYWWFGFHMSLLWKMPPQIWRLVTMFLITHPQLAVLFDTYFLYTYMSQLEVGNPRFPRKEDLIWYMIFIGGANMMFSYLTGFGCHGTLQALILALCYTATQDQRGMKVNFMFINIPAQLTPYAMLVSNLFFPGGVNAMFVQFQGLLAGHLYEFLTRIWPEYGGGRNLIPTPRMISRIVGAVGAALNGLTDSGRIHGSSSRGRGPLPDSWRTRGPGHRLG